MKASKLLCISLLLNSSAGINLKHKALSHQSNKQSDLKDPLTDFLAEKTAGQGTFQLQIIKPTEDLDFTTKLTKEDTKALTIQKIHDTVKDDQEPLVLASDKNQITEDQKDESKKEKEIAGETQAMKSEIREIQEEEQEDKREGIVQKDDDPLAPEATTFKHDSVDNKMKMNAAVSSALNIVKEYKIKVPEQMPKDSSKVNNNNSSKAQFTSREEEIADEMEKEDTTEGDFDDLSKRPGAKKGEKKQLLWQSNAHQNIEEADAATAFVQEQNKKFDAEQAQLQQKEDNEKKVKAQQQMEKAKVDYFSAKTVKSQQPATKAQQGQVVAQSIGSQIVDVVADVKIEVSPKEPATKEEDVKVVVPSSKETATSKESTVTTNETSNEESKVGPKSALEQMVDNLTDDDENEKALKKLGQTVKTDEEVQAFNMNKLAKENGGRPIIGLDVNAEIEKLKGTTYDNLLVTGKEIEKSELSPPLQSLESELKVLQSNAHQEQSKQLEKHVTPMADTEISTAQKKSNADHYFSTVNHNHSDSAPQKEDQKIDKDQFDIASGIVENLQENLQQKKEDTPIKEEKKVEAKVEKKTEEAKKAAVVEAKKAQIKQLQKEVEQTEKKEVKQDAVAEAKKAEEKAEVKVVRLTNEVKKPLVAEAKKEEKKEAPQEPVKKEEGPKEPMQMISNTVQESVDRLSNDGGFIQKYAQAQVSREKAIVFAENEALSNLENSFVRQQMDRQLSVEKPKGIFARMEQKVTDDEVANMDAQDFVQELQQSTDSIVRANTFLDIANGSGLKN